jgi:hypothetical protein
MARFDEEAAAVDEEAADGPALVFLLALRFEVVASLSCRFTGFGLAMAAALPLPFLVRLGRGSSSLLLSSLPSYFSSDVLLFSSC